MARYLSTGSTLEVVRLMLDQTPEREIMRRTGVARRTIHRLATLIANNDPAVVAALSCKPVRLRTEKGEPLSVRQFMWSLIRRASVTEAREHFEPFTIKWWLELSIGPEVPTHNYEDGASVPLYFHESQ